MKKNWKAVAFVTASVFTSHAFAVGPNAVLKGCHITSKQANGETKKKRLDVSHNYEGKVTLEYSTSAISQRFDLAYNGAGSNGGTDWFISSEKAGYCPATFADSKGTDLTAENCTSGTYWNLVALTDGTYKIRDVYDLTKNWDMSGASTALGTILQLWTWTGADNQKFVISDCTNMKGNGTSPAG